jgi:hypothetical protein
MPDPINCTFDVRHDDFSAQVSCKQDPKFWFRVELAGGEDHITDFFLGSFDPALGGDLLAMCYAKVSRVPQDRLVFDDILSSRPCDPDAIKTARGNLEAYARAMLANYGRSLRSSRIARRRGKFDLMLDA